MPTPFSDSLPASPTRPSRLGSASSSAAPASASTSHSSSTSSTTSSSHTPLASPTLPRNHLAYPFLLSPSLSQRRLTSQSAAKRLSSHSRQHRGSSDSNSSSSSSAHEQHAAEADENASHAGADSTTDSDSDKEHDTERVADRVSQRSISAVQVESNSGKSTHGSCGMSPRTGSAPSATRSISADAMADKLPHHQQPLSLSDKPSHSYQLLDQPLTLPHAYKMLAAAAADSSRSAFASPSKLSPHLLPHLADSDASNLAAMLLSADQLPIVAPMWSSFSATVPPPAIRTSFINTLLLSDRSCLILCCINFAIYFTGLLLLLLLAPYLPGGHYTDTYHSGFWHGFHVWCCLAATLLLFVLFSTPSSKKQRISAIALCILLICVFTYLVFALQLLPVYTDLFGHELYPLRYMEWLCTTPLMLLLVANLDVQPLGLVLWIVAADAGMVVTGLLASISPNYSVMLIWLVVSFMCELDTLTHMHALFVQYRQLVGSYPRILLTINFLGTKTPPPATLFWSADCSSPSLIPSPLVCCCVVSELWLYAAYAWFPAIWCLSAAGLVSDDSTSNLYFIGDTMGKLLYTAALLIINFEIVDHADQLSRVQYEAEMRFQMITEKLRSQEESRQQALVSNERKREFLRYILHEIRVPLNALVLGLEGLKLSVDETGGGMAAAPSGWQQGKERDNAAQLAAFPTAVASASVRARVPEETEEDDEQVNCGEGELLDVGPSSRRSSMGTSPQRSPQRSPLPSPTLERSPCLFSNSSILPSTTSLSRASTLALSSTSSPASPIVAAGSSVASTNRFSSSGAVTLCEDDADSINEMWHAVSHMTRLLDDVLSLQRIEDGELLLERRAFSLQDTCVGAVRMMNTWLENKGLRVRCDVDVSLPIVVSDEYRVRQVLINFLSNAIRFTPDKSEDGSEGRIVLTVKRCAVFDDLQPIIEEGQSDELEASASKNGSRRSSHSGQPDSSVPSAELSSNPSHLSSASLTSNPTSSPVGSPRQPLVVHTADSSSSRSSSPPPSPARLFIRVSVHDSGIGIPFSDLQRMFTPFVQISSGEAAKGKGTGLGLSICRKLIDLLGGRVGVISSPGKGSTFFFEAPFEVSADQSSASAQSAGHVSSNEATSRTVNNPTAAAAASEAATADITGGEPAASQHDSPQLISSSLRSKRRAMHVKQKSSVDVNTIPLHPTHHAQPTSIALAASSTQHVLNAPLSPVRMVARALTVPLASVAAKNPPPPRPAQPTVVAVSGAPPTALSAVAGHAVTFTSPNTAAPASAALSSSVAVSSSRPARSAAVAPRPRAPAAAPLRVLVVDDADSNRKLLARLVSKDGRAVCSQARDGQEAVNMIVDDVNRFDVILVSINNNPTQNSMAWHSALTHSTRAVGMEACSAQLQHFHEPSSVQMLY